MVPVDKMKIEILLASFLVNSLPEKLKGFRNPWSCPVLDQFWCGNFLNFRSLTSGRVFRSAFLPARVPAPSTEEQRDESLAPVAPCPPPSTQHQRDESLAPLSRIRPPRNRRQDLRSYGRAYPPTRHIRDTCTGVPRS
ncbi:hypothetical protein T484DRAFT_1953000 [Baffinella frigidus]|nr:hypothetical protein T484DRAFT_1953000 [Cryptophyta sp. CCMP2293]